MSIIIYQGPCPVIAQTEGYRILSDFRGAGIHGGGQHTAEAEARMSDNGVECDRETSGLHTRATRRHALHAHQGGIQWRQRRPRTAAMGCRTQLQENRNGN
jgi:hypothetical protein